MELTITQAAQALDCSVDTVRRHIRRGKLRARKDEHGRYLIQFDDVPTPKRDRTTAGSLDWLSAFNFGEGWPEPSEEGVAPSAGGAALPGLRPAASFVEREHVQSIIAPQRRRTDPGSNPEMARLLQEREQMALELQRWRNEAAAAQAALEELRRTVPAEGEAKRPRGRWRFRR